MFNLIDIGSSFAVMLGETIAIMWILARVNSSLLSTLDISYWPLISVHFQKMTFYLQAFLLLNWEGLFCPPFLAAAGFSLWVWPHETSYARVHKINSTESLSG